MEVLPSVPATVERVAAPPLPGGCAGGGGDDFV